MLSSQITDLAGLGRGLDARGELAALVGVQMRQSAIAVSAGRYGLVVNVVAEGTHRIFEAQQMYDNTNTSAVGVGSEFDLSGHGAIDEVGGITIPLLGFLSI